jgi:2-(1,2-epoxy-1,2-dihydrophenyl)acetyl-CoA isomerase
MDFETIILKKEGPLATIVFNRPHRLNAVTNQMNAEIPQAIQEVARDDSIRVLVLTGAGRAFCAGGDHSSTPDSLVNFVMPQRTPEKIAKTVRGYTRPITVALQELSIPTIAMVNGVAVGQGFSMTQACDIRFGSENAKFMVGWTNRGLAPAFGDTWMLPRIIGLGRALELIYTARMLEAEEALQIGLLNRLVPARDLEKETLEFARALANGPPIALRMDKQITYDGLHTDLPAVLDALAVAQGICLCSDDWEEATMAFQQKRAAVFKGK